MTQRRAVFDRRLDKSIYRINFDWEDIKNIPATFERFKQDETETFRYLFTDYDMMIPNGTVLFLPEPIRDSNGKYPEKSGPHPITPDLPKDSELRAWMIYYLEDSNAKGYNRYVMLRMTHYLTWKDREGNDRASYAYMYGQEDNMLIDETLSRSRMDTVYSEPLKSSFFIMPANVHLRKDDYFIIDKEVNNKVLDEFYRVTGYDIQSQDNVEYVTVDPIYEFAADYYNKVVKEKVPEDIPEEEREKKQKEIDDNYFWLGDKAIEGDEE